MSAPFIKEPAICSCLPDSMLCDLSQEVHFDSTLCVEILGRDYYRIHLGKNEGDDCHLVHFILAASVADNSAINCGRFHEMHQNGQIEIFKFCPEHGHVVVKYPLKFD